MIDAEYSKQLDRIVTVSATPSNQLHIVDPLTGASLAVDLPVVPACVSVGPDGLFAAVGHNGWISYFSLSTPALIKTLPVTTDVLDIVLAGNGWVYAFPRYDQWERIRCINLETGEEMLSGGGDIFAGTVARLHPNGNSMYGALNGGSNFPIMKFDITQGPAVYLYDSETNDPVFGNLWISEDGSRIFNGSGMAFQSSENQAEDLIYNGFLESIGSIVSLSHSASVNKVLAIPGGPDTEIWRYDDEVLSFEAKIKLPAFSVNGQTYPSHGKFVFFSADGTQYSVITQADPNSGIFLDYGIFTLGTDIKQFSIQATASTGGTITPSGDVAVYQGNTQSFTITPGTGYHILNVTVDGSSVGAVTSYEFTNVTADHTITASFALDIPGTATLVSPTGTITDNTPTYTWNATSNSTSYYLWVNDSTGNKIQKWYTAAEVGCASGTGTCSVTPVTQVIGSCWWWIQTSNSASYGPWSTPLSFTVNPPAPPPAPTPVSPSGTIVTTTPTYTWNAVPTASDYYLWVSDSSGVKIQTWYTATQAGCGTGTGNCSVTPVTTLNPGVGQWWVQARNAVGSSPWSAGMSFTIQIPLVAATPLTPAEGSTITTGTPTYTWTAVPAATWYYLSSDDPTGNRNLQWYISSAAGCESGTGNCSVTPSTTLSSGACRWKVQTWNSSSGYGPWSPQVNFTVNVPEPKATLVSPTGTIVTATPTYVWNAVSESTWYQISVDNTTGNKIRQWYTAAQANCGSGTGDCSVTPSTAVAAGAATWKVQTWVNGGAGPWSIPMPFTVNVPAPPQPPVAPNLISPSGTMTATAPTYLWNAVSNATDYYLWVSDSSGNRIQQWYTATAAGCEAGTGNCSVTPATTLNIGAGQWWVQAKNSVGTSLWSAPLSFTVTLSGATLISPSGTITTTTPTYTWNAIPGSTWYYLNVDDSTEDKILQWTTAAQAGCPSGTGTCSVTPTAFVIEAGQWQIQTWGSGTAGPWSAPLAFNAPSLSGTWGGTITSYVRGTFAFGLTITQNGSSLSGVLYDSEVGDIPFAGNIVGNSANLTFSYIYQGYTVTGTFNLTLTGFDGLMMPGNYTLTECILGYCQSDSGTFSLTKQ